MCGKDQIKLVAQKSSCLDWKKTFQSHMGMTTIIIININAGCSRTFVHYYWWCKNQMRVAAMLLCFWCVIQFQASKSIQPYWLESSFKAHSFMCLTMHEKCSLSIRPQMAIFLHSWRLNLTWIANFCTSSRRVLWKKTLSMSKDLVIFSSLKNV